MRADFVYIHSELRRVLIDYGNIMDRDCDFKGDVYPCILCNEVLSESSFSFKEYTRYVTALVIL